MNNNYFEYNWENIGKRIKYEREREGLSQEELGEKINAARQTVSKWERNDSRPSLEDMLNLCRIFQCELGYLLCEYDCKTREATDINKSIGLSEEAINFLSVRLKKDEIDSDLLEVLSDLILKLDFWKAISSLRDAIYNAECVRETRLFEEELSVVSQISRRGVLLLTGYDILDFYRNNAQHYITKAFESILETNTEGYLESLESMRKCSEITKKNYGIDKWMYPDDEPLNPKEYLKLHFNIDIDDKEAVNRLLAIVSESEEKEEEIIKNIQDEYDNSFYSKLHDWIMYGIDDDDDIDENDDADEENTQEEQQWQTYRKDETKPEN